MEYLTKTDILTKPGPLIGRKAYQLVAEVLGEDDPYKSIKEEYNNLALEHYDEIKKFIYESEDPLFSAIVVSAIGNTVDFGTHHHIDLINDIQNFSPDNVKINDIPDFKKSLEKANQNGSQLLLLLDNAGEIVFDKILIEYIKKLYPNLEIICSVRSGPIINDATMEDVEYINLDKISKIIKAPAAPGIELSIASEEFKNYFYEKNGIILSKGQGNFESLYKIVVPNKELFYLLKAKCNLMEKIFKVKLGDLILKKKTQDF